MATSRKQDVEALLSCALRDNRLMLHYQPQLDSITNQIIGMEALLRLNTDDGVMLPGQFIPVAEKTGLILQIGEYAIHETCRQIARWNRNGFAPQKIGVNVSGSQFSADLVVVVEAALREYDVPAHALGIEITESMLANDLDGAILVMRELQGMGIDLSIDDFGTGYSGLSMLKRLPVKTVKIDKEFVNGILHDENDRVIIRAIQNIARHMKLETLAEGVETEDQRLMLCSLGCHSWQGYLFSHPLPAEELENRILTLAR